MDLTKIEKSIKGLNILIIGDIILDKYLFSKVERISPEAPIPIARIERKENRLGGAANVALNIKKLGANTTLIGIIGKDEDAKEITTELKQQQIIFIPFFPSDYQTITKTRVLSENNQLIRIDKENRNFSIDKKTIKDVNSFFERSLNKYDIIIISDYNKGFINQDILNAIINSKKYICIDTKSSSLNIEGTKFIKPNFNEAKSLAKNLGNNQNFENNDHDLENLGKYLKEKLKTNLLITRSEKGATYIGDEIIHSKTHVSNIKDITGAGDTCLAIFSILDFLKVNKEMSLEIMNTAAKITISQVGTYSPSIEEIRKESKDKNSKKILTIEDIQKEIEELKKQGKKIVFTNGCFDLLHEGHINYLKNAKEFGDILIVGLNSDESIRKIKGNGRPIINEASRAYLLSHLDFVDYITIFNEITPEETIEKIKPDIHTKGSDWDIKKMPETKIVESYGGCVKLIPIKKDISTTKIINKIKSEID